MDAITITVEIKEDRHLVIDLPPDTPIGTAQITIQPQQLDEVATVLYSEREAIRAKLQAAGLLSTVDYTPENTEPLSSEERERIWKLFSEGRSSDEIINDERGSY